MIEWKTVLGNLDSERKQERSKLEIWDRYWMVRALCLARQAESEGEVPVGSVLVRDNELIGQGYNRAVSGHDPCAHAEIIALRQAGHTLRNYRLADTTLYVTLEPCPMCAGAMVHARVSRVVFGAYDPKSGAAGSVFSLLQSDLHNHWVEIAGGVLESCCAEVLRSFFRDRRAQS